MNYYLKDGIVLFNHQKAGIEAALKNPGGFGNFCEPGCGKTLMTIAAMNILRIKGEVSKVLIVCPNSLKYVWRDELLKSDLKWHVEVLDGSAKKRKDAILHASKKSFPCIITNYDSLDRISDALNFYSPLLIIADEATAIKNHKAKKTKALKKIKTKYRWALTGTPVVNNILDLWSIFDWMIPGYLGVNFYAYRGRYCIIWNGSGFPVLKGYQKLDELRKLTGRYSYRVLKSECLDLPEKTFVIREFELDPEHQKIYDAMANEMILELGDKQIVASNALGRLLKLHQITGGFVTHEDGKQAAGSSKLDILKELLQELEFKKVVIWCAFKEEVRAIAAFLLNEKRPYQLMTGDQTPEERDHGVKTFQQKNDSNDVFIGTVQTGGMGITLTESSDMIYYSNTWSLGDRIQSADRCHRIGQKNPVTIYDLIAKSTIDGYILKCIQGKAQMASHITGDYLKKILVDK